MMRKYLSFMLLGALVFPFFAPFGFLVQHTSAAPATNVIISEVEYDVTGNESQGEWIELYNPTNAAVSLSGWTIAEGGGSVYTFTGGVSVDAFSYLLIGNDSSEFTSEHSGLALDVDMQKTHSAGCYSDSQCLRLNNTSDSLVLTNDNAVIIDAVEWGSVAWANLSASQGNSICRTSTDDTNTENDWASNCSPSPGQGSLGVGKKELSYSISKPYDINFLQYKTEASFSGSLSYVDPSGTKLYIAKEDGRVNEITEYTLTIPNDISSAVPTNAIVPIEAAVGGTRYPGDIYLYGMGFSDDGLNLYLGVYDETRSTFYDSFYQYTLTTPFDLSTVSMQPTKKMEYVYPNYAKHGIYGAIIISSDGMKMLVQDRQYFREYSFTTPFDISTISRKGIMGLGADNSIVSRDGKVVIDMIGTWDSTLRKRVYRLEKKTLATPFDTSTLSGVEATIPISISNSLMNLSYDGTKLWFAPYSEEKIQEFTFSSGDKITEVLPENIGNIENTIGFSLENETFSDPNGDGILDPTSYNIGNIPSGLTASISLHSSGTTLNTSGNANTALLTLTGTSINHENMHDADLSFQFFDSAFNGGNASIVKNSGSFSPVLPGRIVDFSDNSLPTDLTLSTGSLVDGDVPKVVGTLSANDQDTGNTLTYSFATGTGDTDNGSFTLSSTGVLRSTFTADASIKDTYNIRVQVSDGIGSIQQSFTLSVNSLDGPANVDSGIRLWLRADAGTSTTANGGAITQWSDQSGKSHNVSQSVEAYKPEFMSNNINFNPTVDFDGGSKKGLVGNISNGFQGNQEHSVYIVSKEESSNDWATFFSVGTNGSNGSLSNIESISYAPTGGHWNPEKIWGGLMTDTPPNTGSWSIDSVLSGNGGTNTTTAYVNGGNVTLSLSNVSVSWNFPSNPIVFLGENTTGSTANRIDGKISEILVYSKKNSAVENKKIHSYLGLKYGITLKSSMGDYLDSGGTSVYNLAADANYKSHIVGLAKDGELDQRISKSQAAGSVLSLTTDDNTSDFTSANGGSRTQMADGEYVVLASNNGTLTSSATSITGYSNKIARQWRAEVTNYTGAVNAKFDIPAISGTDWDLVQSDTSDFTDAGANLAKVADLDANGEALDVTFVDGKYYSIIQAQAVLNGPADVDANVALWLKADSGLTLFGSDVSGWNDQSGNNRNISQKTGNPQQKINEINFNPSVYFDGNDSLFNNTWSTNPALSAGDKTFSYIAVFNRDKLSSTLGSVFEQSKGLVSSTRAGYLTSDNTQGFVGAFNDTWNQAPLDEDKVNLGILTLDNNPDNNASHIINGEHYRARASLNYSALNIEDDIFHVGNSVVNEYFVGDIAEIIVYNKDYSYGSTEINKIQSYLALKYGITLSGTGYVSSSGSTVYDLTDGYNQNIVGLGNDASLDQRVSKSTNSGSILTISTDNDFISANGGTRTEMGTGTYIVLGSTGSTSTGATELPSGYTERLQREWKVQETGAVGSIYLKFDGYNADWDLLEDTDGDFSNATKVGDLSSTGTVSYDLVDGRYYTLAKPVLNAVPSDITLSGSSINENVGTGATVGTLSTTDTDVSDTHTYSFSTGAGDTDNGSFTLSGSLLRINVSPDFETQSSYSVRIETNDGNGGTFQKALTISVVDLDEIAPVAPTLSLPTDFSPLTGTGEVDSVISVYSSTGTLLFTGSVSSTGSFSITPSVIPTVFPLTVTSTDASGNESSKVSITGSASDLDGDGILNTVEDSTPNNGDTNGDGVMDRNQSFVASVPNVEVGNGAYITLQTDNVNCKSVRRNESLADPESDAGYKYPLGLLDFQVECLNPGDSTTVTLLYDKQYDTTGWIYRKQDGGSFRTLTGVTFGTHTYASGPLSGTTVTKAVFTVTDGDANTDDDNLARFITDPSGPAILAVSSTGGAGGSRTYACRDPKATNYKTSGFSKNNLCEYASNNVIVPSQEEAKESGENMESEQNVIESNTLEKNKNNLIQPKDYTIKDDYSYCSAVKGIQGNATATQLERYNDIAENPYKKQINKFSELGIIQGYEDKSFGPKNMMTRSEFLKVALKAHCSDYSKADTSTLEFVDVDLESWQARVIAYALDKGMIHGDVDAQGRKVFRPNDVISKIEATKILMRFSGIGVKNPEPLAYKDISTPWHKTYVQTGQNLGLFEVESDGDFFLPNDGFSREKMIDLVDRLVNLYNK